MEPQDLDDIPQVTKEEAIAEVRRWLDVEKVDPDRIFTQMGDQVIRYGDLVARLEQDTLDGKLLRYAISRGRIMKTDQSRALQHLLQIALPPAAEGKQPAEPASSDGTTPAA